MFVIDMFLENFEVFCFSKIVCYSKFAIKSQEFLIKFFQDQSIWTMLSTLILIALYSYSILKHSNLPK